MKQEELITTYTVALFKPHIAKSNEDKIDNIVNHEFQNQSHLHVVVSNLTYVRVGEK